MASITSAVPRRLGRLLALRLVRGRLARVLALPPGGQLFGGREGIVGAALVDELLCVPRVDLDPFALPVGTAPPADVGALLPLDAGPAQRLHQAPLVLAGGPRPVGVLYAQHQLAAAAAGEGHVEQGDVGGADVGGSGRRGGYANADGWHDAVVSGGGGGGGVWNGFYVSGRYKRFEDVASSQVIAARGQL